MERLHVFKKVFLSSYEVKFCFKMNIFSNMLKFGMVQVSNIKMEMHRMIMVLWSILFTKRLICLKEHFIASSNWWERSIRSRLQIWKFSTVYGWLHSRSSAKFILGNFNKLYIWETSDCFLFSRNVIMSSRNDLTVRWYYLNQPSLTYAVDQAVEKTIS